MDSKLIQRLAQVITNKDSGYPEVLKALQDVLDGGAGILNSAEKTTPVDADVIGVSDSAEHWMFKMLSWANIKATLKTYFDTVYPTTRLLSKTGSGVRALNGNSGDVSYTGVGFAPTSANAVCNVAGSVYTSFGFADSAKIALVTFMYAANLWYTNSLLVCLTDNVSWSQYCVIKSYDNDGFTLTWTKVGTPPAVNLTFEFIFFR